MVLVSCIESRTHQTMSLEPPALLWGHSRQTKPPSALYHVWYRMAFWAFLFLAFIFHSHPVLGMLDCDPAFVKNLDHYLSSKVPNDVPNRQAFLKNVSMEILSIYRTSFRDKPYLRIIGENTDLFFSIYLSMTVRLNYICKVKNDLPLSMNGFRSSYKINIRWRIHCLNISTVRLFEGVPFF